MSHWKAIEELAARGHPVAVVFLGGTWTVSVGGQVRSDGKATAADAIGEALVLQAEAGLEAIAELEKSRRKLALLGNALKGAA